MDSRSGESYESRDAALAAGVPGRYIVEITGDPKTVRRVIGRYKMASKQLAKRRRIRRAAQKQSRRANR